jgi:hypothetical protein
MKKIIFCITVLLVLLIYNAVFAQEDNSPYLSNEDMDALEAVLPFDSLEYLAESPGAVIEAPDAEHECTGEACENCRQEIKKSEQDTKRPVFHLIILDRIYSPLESDIKAHDKMVILYNFRHDKNGYLIAIYKTQCEESMLPVLPEKSLVIVNFSSVQKSMIQDYVNSGAFKRLITNRAVMAGLGDLFDREW